MKKPTPKHEIVTHIREDQQGTFINFYIASCDMKYRFEEESVGYGEFVIFNHDGVYMLDVYPTFDYFEVAKYLGRDGAIFVKRRHSKLVPIEELTE
jgi:hypothetical protein